MRNWRTMEKRIFDSDSATLRPLHRFPLLLVSCVPFLLGFNSGWGSCRTATNQAYRNRRGGFMLAGRSKKMYVTGNKT